MGVYYDKNGNCTTCGLPGSGFVVDGVCHCLDDEDDIVIEPEPWTDEDEAALEEYEESKRRRLAEQQEY